MFAYSLLVIYFLEVFICLLISFLRRKDDNSYLYLYFLLILIVELLNKFTSLDGNRLYTIASFLYMSYFTYYYAQTMPRHRNLIIGLGVLANFLGLVFVLTSNQTFSVALGVTVSVFFVFLALFWFFTQINKTNSVIITRKQAFWVSTALLVWSVIFLFRSSLMYWLEENDLEFLLLFDNVFKIFVVVTYFAFLIAVTRKKMESQ
ncbi:MAG: hypothetical protein ACOH1X_00980 [Kaistella sp.]